MTRAVILFLVAVFVGFVVDKGCCLENSVDRQFPLGTIGCLITETLCGPDEECVDDLLFGNCQKSREEKNYYQYHPNREILEILEHEIVNLIQSGQSWQDPYTQCLLQNMLVSYRTGQSFIRDSCSEGTVDWSTSVSDEINNVLLQIYDAYSNADKSSRDLPDLGSDWRPSDKRDEIVQVHKYFDESATPFKRRLDPQPDSDQELYQYLYKLASDISPEEPATYSSEDKARDDITLDDLRELRLLLQPTERQSEEDDDGLYSRLDESLYPNSDEASNIAPLKKNEVGEQMEYSPDAQNLGWMWAQEPSIDGSLLKDLESDVEVPVKSPNLSADNMENFSEEDLLDNNKDLMDPATNNYLTISPPDAKLLLDLLQGTSEPKSMDNNQLDRMIVYINSLLTAYGINDAGTNDLTSSEEVQGPTDPDVDTGDSSLRSSSEDFDTASSVQAKILAPEEPQAPIVETKKAIFDDEEDKGKVDNSPVREESSHFDVVDANYIILKMAKPISEESAGEVIRTLEDILQVPSGAFQVQQVQDDQIRFLVDPRASGMNATVVSSKIDGLKHDLEKTTGLQILSYTLEGEDQIQLIKHDADSPKYFVLTFVLCGSIAGILLAVVIIYLIKRHARSKEKLSRLSAEGGGLEASQDYQDLCRQRMQSKTSEKPEPLHAASRVSSVQSESQVRSPSSRSSTSSWSEEPVTSNMDISTGHIVLSYMEDHLKNKDRLDREWEALCSYEADPNSTKMAVDPANTRKNRYSDILPYDHSRVILTDTTNVSGSDYINASTITDHDPRNPAYISTQGPLPHTVADFWQLIWEQGSVVIVMLTKLTENGEAMCHRYWPEEGSDLYHIYEVHLVSEHIWCDDYLVRSFYLKNLQTNETRTVTQFHFLSWHELSVPTSIKALLEFRRKVNKSYRGRSCPIVVHCSDGCGRSGTYSVIDMVLNRMAKGAKEIDIAATLEHIRDQRMLMVKTKEQFQFALAAVAEEVHAILKALPQ